MSSKNEPGASQRVFVGGISWKADEQSLANFFSSFGKVLECKIIMDKVTGKSKGYGFVTFESAESAAKVKQSNNLYFLGKTMNVGDAMRKNEGNDGSGQRERGGDRENRDQRGGNYNPYYNQQSYYQQQQQAFYQPGIRGSVILLLYWPTLAPGYVVPYGQPPPFVNYGSPAPTYVPFVGGQPAPFVNFVPGSPTHAMAVDQSGGYTPVWQPIPAPQNLQHGTSGSPSQTHPGSPTTIHYQPVVIAPYQPPLQYNPAPSSPTPQSPSRSSPSQLRHAHTHILSSSPQNIPGLSHTHSLRAPSPQADQSQQLQDSGEIAKENKESKSQ